MKTAGTNEVEIAWEPPKGDFTKYILTVDSNMTKSVKPVPENFNSMINKPEFYSQVSHRFGLIYFQVYLHYLHMEEKIKCFNINQSS